MKRRASLPDTNFILRYLLRDNEEHFAEAADFLKGFASAKNVRLFLNPCW